MTLHFLSDLNYDLIFTRLVLILKISSRVGIHHLFSAYVFHNQVRIHIIFVKIASRPQKVFQNREL